jgi:hypothetical protein
MPIQVKIGLAYCYIFLEKYQLATLWLNYILSKESSNILAILGLANISFRSSDYPNYNKYLQMAYKIDKDHPELLLILAE